MEARFYVTINQRLHFFPDYPRHFLLNYKNTTCTIYISWRILYAIVRHVILFLKVNSLFFIIVQIVAEKQKFRKTPFNYAQKKNNLMRSKVSNATLYYIHTFVERLCGVIGCFEDWSVSES